MNSACNWPLPDRPTNLRSLNLATWFLNDAHAFLSSAAQFSSFPAVKSTLVPSETSLSDSTLKGTGRVLLHLQCDGKMVQTKLGLFVLTSSPGYSASNSENVLSPRNLFDGGIPSELQFEVESDPAMSFMCIVRKSVVILQICFCWVFFLFF